MGRSMIPAFFIERNDGMDYTKDRSFLLCYGIRICYFGFLQVSQESILAGRAFHTGLEAHSHGFWQFRNTHHSLKCLVDPYLCN